MAQIYNISSLVESSNLAEWVLILNGWSSELLFTGLAIGMVLVLFGIMTATGNSVPVSFTAACYLGLFISWLMWLLGQYYGISAIPILIPIMLTTFAAIGSILIAIKQTI